MMKNRRVFGKLIFLIFGGALSLALLIVGGFQLITFSDSVAFCGVLCHKVMKPEYTAYQNSPHSRVLCVDCHVGPGTSYFVRSKITGIPLVWATLTGNFNRPIPTPVTSLRPARETCEQCHRPERFAGDLVQTNVTYATDEANTETTDTRVFRVGGGQAGEANGIHWHITASVYYLPLDEKRQDIAWVGVDNGSGQLTEYISPDEASEVTQDRINQEKRLMDCIDCHNRATHIFRSPGELVDDAMTQGLIDTGLPYIKREIVSVLDPPNPSLEEADSRVEGLSEFYRTNYPQVYAEKQDAIDQAISQAKHIAELTTFPYMMVTWNTYQSNIGHINSPGCFRCHGKLVAENGPQSGSTIDSNCTLCHYEINISS
jgi:nitrate/TMAO reductase-like tetraheme cytochrome c subunit